jgi:hypothetical protein
MVAPGHRRRPPRGRAQPWGSIFWWAAVHDRAAAVPRHRVCSRRSWRGLDAADVDRAAALFELARARQIGAGGIGARDPRASNPRMPRPRARWRDCCRCSFPNELQTLRDRLLVLAKEAALGEVRSAGGRRWCWPIRGSMRSGPWRTTPRPCWPICSRASAVVGSRASRPGLRPGHSHCCWSPAPEPQCACGHRRWPGNRCDGPPSARW